MTTALITGGTSGLGAAFARRLAAEGDDLVLVARDGERLSSMAAELHERCGVDVETLVADLSTSEGVAIAEARLADEERPVDLFVNNAGMGMKGAFLDKTADEHEHLLRLNALAVLRLTHAAATTMAQRGNGDIINVSSVAGFTPAVRPSSTYAATKAFVTALSEGLAPSLAKKGVRMSALCPGWVQTEFHIRAGLNMTKLPKFLWLDADKVVETALEDHRAGKFISIPSIQYKVIVAFMKICPRSLSRRLSRLVGRKAR